MTKTIKPKGAIAFVDGSYIKLGRNDQVYRWADGEWLKSEKSAADVIREVTRTGQNYEHNNRWVSGCGETGARDNEHR